VSFLEYGAISNEEPENSQDERMIVEEVNDNDDV
jgi:hypothetical protein